MPDTFVYGQDGDETTAALDYGVIKGCILKQGILSKQILLSPQPKEW